MTHASRRLILGFWFIVSFVILGNIQMAKADDTPTVEGVWEITGGDLNSQFEAVGDKIKIYQEGLDYHIITLTVLGHEAGPAGSPGVWIGDNSAFGNSSKITHNEPYTFERLKSVMSSNVPGSVLAELAGKNLIDTITYELTGDGNTLLVSKCSPYITFDRSTGKLASYQLDVGYYKTLFKRISGPVPKSASSGDHAYPADCSNPKDMCYGNLVAMTYFCGGNTECTYVCCPRGLPYLNHCDCKCYATADFDCHSYSKAQEQPKQ